MGDPYTDKLLRLQKRVKLNSGEKSDQQGLWPRRVQDYGEKYLTAFQKLHTDEYEQMKRIQPDTAPSTEHSMLSSTRISAVPISLAMESSRSSYYQGIHPDQYREMNDFPMMSSTYSVHPDNGLDGTFNGNSHDLDLAKFQRPYETRQQQINFSSFGRVPFDIESNSSFYSTVPDFRANSYNYDGVNYCGSCAPVGQHLFRKYPFVSGESLQAQAQAQAVGMRYPMDSAAHRLIELPNVNRSSSLIPTSLPVAPNYCWPSVANGQQDLQCFGVMSSRQDTSPAASSIVPMAVPERLWRCAVARDTKQDVAVNRRPQKKKKKTFKLKFEKPFSCFRVDIKEDTVVLWHLQDPNKKDAEKMEHDQHQDCGVESKSDTDTAEETITSSNEVVQGISLKGIDMLHNGKYRVQLNAFMTEKKKYSKNSSSLYEAIWVFEMCLLISDNPKVLTEMLRIGNYQSIVSLGHDGLFLSPHDYYLEFLRTIVSFAETSQIFTDVQICIAIQNFDRMTPSFREGYGRARPFSVEFEVAQSIQAPSHHGHDCGSSKASSLRSEVRSEPAEANQSCSSSPPSSSPLLGQFDSSSAEAAAEAMMSMRTIRSDFRDKLVIHGGEDVRAESSIYRAVSKRPMGPPKSPYCEHSHSTFAHHERSRAQDPGQIRSGAEVMRVLTECFQREESLASRNLSCSTFLTVATQERLLSLPGFSVKNDKITHVKLFADFESVCLPKVYMIEENSRHP